MDIQSNKIELVKYILQIDNPNLLERFMQFVKNESVDFWDELSTKQKNDIKLGIAQYENGEATDFYSFLNSVS